MASSRNRHSIDRPLREVGACLKDHVAPGQRLALGLSGGLDSVVLLHLLLAIREEIGISVAAVHVHHDLSPNADAWQAFCERLCREWSVPLRVARVQVDHDSGEGLECAARRARYDAFKAEAADWIALAQHRDDQAETLLFNLLRGAGVRGAAAMPVARENILRPLLKLGRSEIEAYGRHHGLRWIEDESNSDRRYSRNFLRHEILPRLALRFPAAKASLAAAAGRFAEAQALLDDLALLDLGQAPARFPLPLARLQALSEARARNLLRLLLARHGVQVPSEERLFEATRQLLTAAPDRHPSIAFGDYLLRRVGRDIHLEAGPGS